MMPFVWLHFFHSIRLYLLGLKLQLRFIFNMIRSIFDTRLWIESRCPHSILWLCRQFRYFAVCNDQMMICRKNKIRFLNGDKDEKTEPCSVIKKWSFLKWGTILEQQTHFIGYKLFSLIDTMAKNSLSDPVSIDSKHRISQSKCLGYFCHFHAHIQRWEVTYELYIVFFRYCFFHSSPVAANKPQRYKTFFFFIRKKSTVNCTTESRDGESNDLMCFFFLEILIRYDGFIVLLIDNGQSCWVWLIGVSNDSGVGCQFVLWQAINYENI